MVKREQARPPYRQSGFPGPSRVNELGEQAYTISANACSRPQILALMMEWRHWHLELDRPGEAAKAHKVLLNIFPITALVIWLPRTTWKRTAPARPSRTSMRWFACGHRDRLTQRMLWNQRIGMVRHFALKRMFEMARRELNAAAGNAPPEIDPFGWTRSAPASSTRRRTWRQPSSTWPRRSPASTNRRPCGWSCMALRCGTKLDRQLKNDFSARFKSAVRGACTSQTAGHMAKYLARLPRAESEIYGVRHSQRELRKYCRDVRT